MSVEEVSDVYPSVKVTSFEVCGSNDVFDADTRVEEIAVDDVVFPDQKPKPTPQPKTGKSCMHSSIWSA